MPWSKSQAKSHTKSANTSAKQKTWAKVANEALKSGKSDASAIKIANSVVKKKK